MRRLVDSPDQEMDLAAVFRKRCRDFLADEGSRLIGDFQAARDPVVIGQRYKVHPSFTQLLVYQLRIRVAVGEFQFPEKPVGSTIAVARMDVEVALHRGSNNRLTFFPFFLASRHS